jgi:hypothetical protein
MGRPRKPIEELKRKPHKSENRGFTSTKIISEVQQEIVFQFDKIKESLKKVDPISEVKTYKILIDELLKIQNQVKTFSNSYNNKVEMLNDD